MTPKVSIQLEMFTEDGVVGAASTLDLPASQGGPTDAHGDDDPPPAGPPAAAPMPELCIVQKPVPLPQTLSEVLHRLREAPPSQRRSDLMSAIQTVCKVLGRPLGDLPASPSALAPLLASGCPVAAEISSVRWSRARTNLRTALRECGYEVLAGRDIAGPGSDWAGLLEALPDRKLQYGLSRLFSYLTRAGITPATVSTTDLQDFSVALAERSLHAHPDRTFWTAMTSWNRARAILPNWPGVEAPSTNDERRYAMAADEFPQTFLRDVDAYLDRAAVCDPFARDYHRQLRPATLKQRRLHIMQLASALVASGYDGSRLTSLAVLSEANNAEAALRHLRDRHAGSSRPQVGLQARTLLTIARHWVKAPEADLKVLSRFASGLSVTHPGMAPSVQVRLRQFDLRPNLNSLLTLPDRVYREVQAAGPPDQEKARRLMLALAVELLTMTPMRMGNVASLSLDRHFQVERRGRAKSLTISLPESETKNACRLSMPVPASTAQLLDVYWRKYCPLLVYIPNAYLFPSRSGEGRSPSGLGAAISRFIRRETGLIMHPHLFRQLAAQLSMASGGGLETARLLLGHTSSVTTERHYVHLRTDKAFQQLDATISKLRKEAGVVTPQTIAGMRDIHGS